jgi:hypothetical protein
MSEQFEGSVTSIDFGHELEGEKEVPINETNEKEKGKSKEIKQSRGCRILKIRMNSTM